MRTRIIGDGWAGLSLGILLKNAGEEYRIETRPERKKPHTTGAILQRHPEPIEEIIERNTVAEIKEFEIRYRGRTATGPIYARMVEPIECLHEMRREATEGTTRINPDIHVDATGAKKGIIGVEYTIKNPDAEQKLIIDFNLPFGTGYTWIFGYEKNKAKIGMISNRGDAKFSALKKYVREHYPNSKIISKMSGATEYGWRNKVVDKNRVLIGDAANQVNPLIYEGIRPAIRAAEALANAIHNEDLSEYQKWHTEKIAKPYRKIIIISKIVRRTGIPISWIKQQGVKELQRIEAYA